jgi:hypothetical protein
VEDNKTQDPSLAKIMPLVLQLMNKGGWNIVEDALDSQNPAQPLGRFLAELIMKVATAAQEKNMQLDMKVFLREGGVVETLLNMMEEHFDMPPEFSDEIFATLVKVIEQGMQAQSQGQQAPPQGQPQQVPPQQGAPGGLDQMGGM